MIKIWGKIYKNEKITKHSTIEVDETNCTFFDMLRQISEKLDIPTPVLLEKHVADFNMFNFSIFKPDDFIQPVNFTKFIIENISND